MGLSSSQPHCSRSQRTGRQQASTPDQKPWLWAGSRPRTTTGAGPWLPSRAPRCPCALCPVGCWHRGLLGGQSRPLHPSGPCSGDNHAPSRSALSTATTPTARSPTCSARPWASPLPRWTAPSGQAGSRRPRSSQGGGGPALRRMQTAKPAGAALAVCPAVLADVWFPMCSGSLLGQRTFQNPMGPSWHVPKVPSDVGWSCHATP